MEKEEIRNLDKDFEQEKKEFNSKKKSGGFHKRIKKKENMELIEKQESSLTKIKEEKKELIETSKNKALDIKRNRERKNKTIRITK